MGGLALERLVSAAESDVVQMGERALRPTPRAALPPAGK
jgi:hypothetical protein